MVAVQFQPTDAVPPFDVTVMMVEDDVVVVPWGELDVATVGQLEPVLTGAALLHPRRVVVDLTGLTFIDATGARILGNSALMLRAAGGQLELRAPNHAVQIVFRLVEMDKVAIIAG